MPDTPAVILPHARGAVAVESMSLADPGRGEVLVRMEACGICHSDLFVAGLERLPLAPLVLGHEGIATVETTGPDVTAWKPGDRVGMTFLATTCGVCDLCRSGRERFCPKQTNFGFSRHGALARYAVVPAAALVRVPGDLPAATLAPLCCAGWTAQGALREAGLERGRKAAIFGFGGLGHLALQLALQRGLRAAVVDLSQEKLEAARDAGAEFTAPAENAGRAIQKEFGGVDAAIVLTPSSGAIQQAFRALSRTGTLVLVGIWTTQYELPLIDTVLKGVTVRGSYLGTHQDLEEVFALARGGILLPHVHTHELEETPAILDRMSRGEVQGRAVVGF